MNKGLDKTRIIVWVSLPVIALLVFFDSMQENRILNFGIEKESEQIQGIGTSKEDEVETYENISYKRCINCHAREDRNIEITPLKQSGWIPPWDFNNGLASIQEFQTEFYSLSPVTFSINQDGSLNARLQTSLTQLKNAIEDKDIKIIPTISNFDADMMKNIFDSTENTQRHIESILKVVNRNNYDGIDLDYESIYSSNKTQYLRFIRDLSRKLQREDKILSVTVLPKWGDDVIYTGLAETRDAQDWAYIGEYADEVRIMAYDFTEPGSPRPGPIGPIDWVEKVLEYAVEKIPREKIWLGVHLYSYEWVMPSNEPNQNSIGKNSYTYDIIKQSILTKENINIDYNFELEEGYADYPCNPHHCIIYYATPRSVNERQNLASKYRIAGVVYWRIGGEADLIR